MVFNATQVGFPQSQDTPRMPLFVCDLSFYEYIYTMVYSYHDPTVMLLGRVCSNGNVNFRTVAMGGTKELLDSYFPPSVLTSFS